MDFSVVERRIGHRFRDPELLHLALTHRSFGSRHNERLEFLGDAVLNCVIAAALFDRFPHVPEGDLSRARANLVNEQRLFNVAEAIRLGDTLQLGEGELKTGGSRRPSTLADALEAVIGAVFLDAGFDASRVVVMRLFETIVANVDPRADAKDPKTRLQEYLQGRRLPLPQYTVLATHGEAHAQRFEVECAIPDLDIRSRGEGTSRRSAEQSAASTAYQIATGRR